MIIIYFSTLLEKESFFILCFFCTFVERITLKKERMKSNMKVFFSYLFLGVILWSMVQPVTAENKKPFVIPELREWKGESGNFVPAQEAKIICDAHNPALLRIAKMFAADYEMMFGKAIEVSSGKAAKGDFLFRIKNDKRLGAEGYTIHVGSKVLVTAPTPTGIYWSTRTLLQMAEQHDTQELPMGEIRDYPDYGIRGFMMDCGRKFIPMSYMKDLVKMMAYYKMNTLQVHLNDNGFKKYFQDDWDKTPAAFRLECDTYPGLAARDGYYTKKEFVEFQQDAFAQFVEIIPEIDAPAHTLAFTHYKPEIGSKEYGMDHLDLFHPETYKFMDNLFNEYLAGENPVFVGPKVHIGTDEYSNKDQKVVEKFREFTDRYIKVVESYGKQVCVWGALTHAKGTTPVKSENVIMSAWYNGYADPKEMVKQGYKLISVPDGLLYIVPAAGYYFDYLDTKMLYNEWTPAHVGKEVFDEKDPAILGGMFAVWNDHIGNGISVKDVHHRTFPALQTLSAKMWTGKNVTVSFDAFDAQRHALSEAPGVNQMGKIGDKPALVYESDKLTPDFTTPFEEIGYDYTVSFDIEGRDEVRGAELFRSSNAVFYLSDPISGSMGFARDGYLSTFKFRLYEGEKAHIEIQGDNQTTLLKVNGKIVADLYKEVHYDHKGKDKIYNVQTLVFPLQKTGQFKSCITNFKVYNYRIN